MRQQSHGVTCWGWKSSKHGFKHIWAARPRGHGWCFLTSAHSMDTLDHVCFIIFLYLVLTFLCSGLTVESVHAGGQFCCVLTTCGKWHLLEGGVSFFPFALPQLAFAKPISTYLKQSYPFHNSSMHAICSWLFLIMTLFFLLYLFCQTIWLHLTPSPLTPGRVFSWGRSGRVGQQGNDLTEAKEVDLNGYVAQIACGTKWHFSWGPFHTIWLPTFPYNALF